MKLVKQLDKETAAIVDGDLTYIEFNGLLEHKDKVRHCMSTRLGGVSKGCLSSLNLGYNRNDLKENVDENYRLLCEAAGFNMDSLVFSNQVHDIHIGKICSDDRSMGFQDRRVFKGCDGLMTNVPGITLVTFYADCVPLLFYDPVMNAIAASHSGWKGTWKDIASETVTRMAEYYFSKPEDIICAIGPSIGKCCFEVGSDVYTLFKDKYPEDDFYQAGENGKFLIDLKGIIKAVLQKKGLKPENIHVSTICTKCSRDMFYSYRGDTGKTGSLAAFISLK